MDTLVNLHNYWRDPKDQNRTDHYVTDDKKERSEYIVSLICDYVDKKASIIELGCNAGRNLDTLYHSGLRNLTGVDISAKAIEYGLNKYQSMVNITTHKSSIEDVIKILPDFDMMFTMAFLEHVHNDSEWILGEIVKRCKYLLTIEDEIHRTIRHTPRNYKEVFESLGMKQITSNNKIDEIMGGVNGFVMRLFRKCNNA